jgi:hypothetical protein
VPRLCGRKRRGHREIASVGGTEVAISSTAGAALRQEHEMGPCIKIGQGASAADPVPWAPTSSQTSGSVWMPKSSLPSLAPSPSVSALRGSVP